MPQKFNEGLFFHQSIFIRTWELILMGKLIPVNFGKFAFDKIHPRL